MRDKIFYGAGFGFLFGVLLRSFAAIDFYSALFILFVAAAILILFIVFKNKWGIVASIFILTLALGILRFNAADVPPPQALESKVEEKITLSGIISDEPSIRENNQHLVVNLYPTSPLRKGEEKEGVMSTRILLFAGLEGDYRYGDEIKFTGVLKKPENFETEQGKIFDYQNYLRKDGILYTMIYPEIEILSRGHGNFVKHGLFAMKNKFLETINFAVPAPESLLMGGLILGERAAFPEELRQNFIDTGTIHIVALSGYNVTIVAEWFMKLFAFLPQALAFGAGIFAIFLFVLMTGANSTAVRAGVMASLALIARANGRDKDAARALLFTAVAMLLWNPFLLVFDASFELSFLATIAVIFFAPKIEKYFLWVTKKFGLRDIVSITFAAYVFVFPFILYKMGNFSLVALPANILVLPLIPLTMAAGFLTGALGLIWYGLAVPLGFISYLMLRYELAVIDFLASLPFAAFSISHFSLVFTLIIYAGFIYVLFGKSIKNFFLNYE